MDGGGGEGNFEKSLKIAKQFMVGAAAAPSRRGRGAPKGNRNALKHGYFTAERLAERAHAQAFFRHVRAYRRHVDDILRALCP